MNGLVRDLVGALVVAVTAYFLGLMHGVVMSCAAFEDALGVEPDGEWDGLHPCPSAAGCSTCDRAIDDLRESLLGPAGLDELRGHVSSS